MEPIKEVMFERLLDVPVSKIFEMWTNPDLLKKWWGPDNVVIPECVVDPRIGGRFFIVMEATSAMGSFAGTRWPMEATYTNIEQDKAISYTAHAWTEGYEESTTIEQMTEVALLEVEGKTKMHVRAAIMRTGPDAKMAVEGMQYGFSQQFDKLEKLLQSN